MKSFEERIAAVNAEIESLQEQLKEKKTEGKELMEVKEAEDQKRIMEALKTSGKTIDDVINFLNAKEDNAEESQQIEQNTED